MQTADFLMHPEEEFSRRSQTIAATRLRRVTEIRTVNIAAAAAKFVICLNFDTAEKCIRYWIHAIAIKLHFTSVADVRMTLRLPNPSRDVPLILDID